MAQVVVDPDRFLLAAALVDHAELARRDPAHLAALHARGDRHRRVVQLRWTLAPSLGVPTAPFEVWTRPALNVQIEKPLPVDAGATVLQTLFGWLAHVVPGPMVYVRAQLTVTSSTHVLAFAGAPFGSPLVGIAAVPPGPRSVSFSGAQIGTLVVMDGARLDSWVGITPSDANEGDWNLVERVGLPVDPAGWGGVFDMSIDQGPVTTPMAPAAAALDRFERGAAPFGWLSQLQAGRPAPAWQQADPQAFLKLMRDDVLGTLRHIVTTLPPAQHAAFKTPLQLALGNGESATGDFSPWSMLLFAGATDPVASLLAGFGTALDEIDVPPVVLGDRRLFADPDRSDHDFRVTATYGRGLDGESAPVTYAALALSPRRAVPPPAPAGLLAEVEGFMSPLATDGRWRAVVQLAWDRLPSGLPLRCASYAHARSAGLGATDLLQRRKFDTAPQPIGIVAADPKATDAGRTRASDDGFSVPGWPSPVTLLYGVAHQDIFGLWSAWATRNVNVAEPPVQDVALLNAELAPVAQSGPCPATLTVDFTWDWRVRSPAAIRFAGALFAQARHNDPPPAGLSPPTAMQYSLGSAALQPLEVAFAPDGSATVPPGATLRHLGDDGRDFLATPLQTAGPRRYRLQAAGFSLDFAAAGHIGIALTAQGTERVLPGRTGDWCPLRVASASDPRPPVVAVEHEDVLLASLPDADGVHHAQLAWPTAPGAAGYFVYAAQESKLLADCGAGQARLQDTLSTRLKTLRDRFASHATQRMFTRLNDTAIGATTHAVTLPRGTTEIHLFVVLGVSAGGIESAWPAPSDPLRRRRPIAYAAPRKRVPPAPSLEARLGRPEADGSFPVHLTVAAAPGIAAARIDLHRVRNEEAVLDLGSMGPPVASAAPGDPRWAARPAAADAAVAGPDGAVVRLVDRPPGSWSPTWYRAAAWSARDASRGLFEGRSAPSAARAVLVPPSMPPDLGLPQVTFPVAGGAVVDVAAATTAPVAATALGPHRVRAEVHARDAQGRLSLLYAWPVHPGAGQPAPDNVLSGVPATAPAGASALVLEPAAAGMRLRLRIHRPDAQAPLRVRLQLDDPLGRMTERIVDVAAGSPVSSFAFGPLVLQRVPAKGFVLSAPIDLPIDLAPSQAVRIRATYRGAPLRLFPPRPMGPPTVVDVAFADIPVLSSAEDPFTAAQPMTVRREAAGAGATVLRYYVAGRSGHFAITASAPGATPATVSRIVF